MDEFALLSRHRGLVGAGRIILIAECWTADRVGEFATTCATLLRGLSDIAPFGLLERHPDRIEAWSWFRPSTVGAPPVGISSPGSPAGAVRDPATGALLLDAARARVMVENTLMPDRDIDPAQTTVDEWLGTLRAPTVACFLLPPSGGLPGEWVSDEQIDGMRVWPPRFIACSADAGWPRIVARALGTAIGLGEEWSDPAPEFAAPADATAAQTAGGYPNLVPGPVPAGPPSASFKWYPELGARARATALGPGTPGPIRLVEGGGRYRTGIYRSAPDCLMRRRLAGDPAASVRSDAVEFCPLCRRLLERAITGWTGPYRRVRLGDQRNEYDRIGAAGWGALARQYTGDQIPDTVVAEPMTVFRPSWSFTARIGAAVGGLRIEDLRLRDQDRPAGNGLPAAPSLAEETVASVIDFRDLAVELEDGTRVSIDLARAFTSTAHPPVLRVGRSALVPHPEPVMQHGIALTVVDDLGRACPIEVTLSLAVRSEAADIEPAGGLVACKFFPQITLRVLRGGSSAVRRMRGSVRVVGANRVRAGGHAHHAGSAATTVASMFTDTNEDAPVGRPLPWMLPTAPVDALLAMLNLPTARLLHRLLLDGKALPAPGFPLWGAIFDYHRPDIRTETEIVAVRGPLANPDLRRRRHARMTWPAGAATAVTTTRHADQGQYDNLHAHGSMGADPFDPRTPQGPMVHAPGCAEACLHQHWRWGALGPLGAVLFGGPQVRMASFRGWSRSGDGLERSEQHTETAAPLIPPNQDLLVALTHPDTARAEPWGGLIAPARALDPDRMASWWTVDVSEPAVGDAQVIGGPGMSFAYRYDFDVPMWQAELQMTRLVAGRLLPTGATDAEVGHLLYSLSRWLLDDADKATGPQIPEGTERIPGSVTLEDL